MKLFKNNNAVSYLQVFLENDEKLGDFLNSYLKMLLHGGLRKILGQVKSKGFDALEIISFLSFMPLLCIGSINGYYFHYGNQVIACRKDVLYRLKNNCDVRWRSIQASIAKRFLKLLSKAAAEDKEVCKAKYLVLDDTVLAKTGKALEFIGRVWDHVSHGYVLGYKLMVLGFYDGKSFLPLDFSLHREKGKRKNRPYGMRPKELRKQYHKERPKGAASQERIRELDEKKTDVGLQMIKRAFKKGFRPDYVLVDSWFFCYALLKLCLKLKSNLICMAKMGKAKFTYQGKAYTPKALASIHSRHQRYCRKLKAWHIDLKVEYQGIEVKIFLVRYDQQQKWHLIVCSDTRLGFIQVMEHYQMRWSIEICFKECKQYLQLGKCQSNDFDAQIADITICFILYTAIALKQRMEQGQSIGYLFKQLRNQSIVATLAEKLWEAFLKVVQKIVRLLDIDPFIFIKKMIAHNVNEELIRILTTEFLDPPDEAVPIPVVN